MANPLPPEEAAAKIVADLLPDLSPGKALEVASAIEDWGREWGDLVAAVTAGG